MDRLDVTVELELFRGAARDWETVFELKRYDPRRLEAAIAAVRQFGHDQQAALGAARISGYQMTVSAIAKLMQLAVTRSEDATSAQIDQLYRTMDWSDPATVAWGKGVNARAERFRDIGRAEDRVAIAEAMLAGLNSKTNLLGDLAPKIPRIRSFLENYVKENQAFTAVECQEEFAELEAACEIDMALIDVEMGRISAARQRLTERLSGKELQKVCQTLAQDLDWRRAYVGILLLGALDSSIENETLILSRLEEFRDSDFVYRTLGKIGGKATIDAITRLSPFAPQQPIGYFYLIRTKIKTLVEIALRDLNLADQVRQTFCNSLLSRNPAEIRRACLIGLYLIYDHSCDDALLSCAWHGFVGRDHRSERRSRLERARVANVREIAIRMLAISSDVERVGKELSEMLSQIELSESDIGWYERWSGWCEWLMQRFTGAEADRARLKVALRASLKVLGIVPPRTRRTKESDEGEGIMKYLFASQKTLPLPLDMLIELRGVSQS